MDDIDRWLDLAKLCKYLPENDLKVNPYPVNYSCLASTASN